MGNKGGGEVAYRSVIEDEGEIFNLVLKYSKDGTTGTFKFDYSKNKQDFYEISGTLELTEGKKEFEMNGLQCSAILNKGTADEKHTNYKEDPEQLKPLPQSGGLVLLPSSYLNFRGKVLEPTEDEPERVDMNYYFPVLTTQSNGDRGVNKTKVSSIEIWKKSK
eukprot:TRINITY_DN2238_c0_g1_i1.p1 TRINITY_DN2238_c0_g1~~TRINITY_DN2238_c0_g1_i1.p1  ORF type:complete len:163 (-),score=39.01 TRINITY_DN2238_c0_g1_i1:105-593(-)